MLQKDTLCHDTSKCLKRLCVYSPEVTGSCLLTSVASTMEPRKVRKLKILTGFRPVSDPLPRCLRNLARPCKKKGPKRNTKGERKNEKKGYKNLNAAFDVKVNGHRQSKENKDIKRMTQLNWHKVSEAEDPGARVPKLLKQGGTSSGTANKEWNQKAFNPWSLLQKDTLCHDTSKCLKRLCVYSPEVTGSCLLTSVASTMEPRKVRKLKILTGFRPVSDQFQTLCPDASETLRTQQKERAKRETQREKERREKRIQKNKFS